MIFFISLCTLLAVILIYLKEVYSRFSKQGVAYFKPIPVLGNFVYLLLKRRHICEDAEMLYKAFPNERFLGRFELTRPLVVLRDLELVKKVAIKDFEHFMNHRSMTDDKIDPIFGRNLLSLKDQEWKDMRAALNPVFTSSKIRALLPLMINACDHVINILKKRISESESDYIDVECRDLMRRISSDIIAECAFGVKAESHIDTDNEFYQHCIASSDFNFRRMLVFLGYSSFPRLMKIMNITFFGEESNRFFKHLFLTSFAERSANNIFRPDVIHFLMEAKKGKLTYDEKVCNQDTGFATVEESDIGKRIVDKEWSDNDLVAQAVMFLVAGFETSSSAMSFLFYELALKPDIQERLVEEIREEDRQNQGKFSFDSIQSLKYLDMVVSETLRLWPPAVGLDRICTKNYNMGKPNDNAEHDYIIHKGEHVLIPVWSIHRDPNYYPDPSKFDPERFSSENKAKIKPFSYLPFGCGPRNCIGSKFALCELKVMVYQLLLQLEISPCEKTPIPAKLSSNSCNLHLKGGSWLRFRLRTY